MLLSAVISLKAVRDCRYDHFTGRGTHGFWLKSWRAADAQVGDWLHAHQWHLPLDGKHAPAPAAPDTGSELIAPYCVSPVMGLPDPEKGVQNIPAGSEAWLRVASFHPELSHRMLDGPNAWLQNLPGRISIDGAEWRVIGQTVDPARHAWAGVSSYEALRHAALDAHEAPTRWTVHFETPTTIRGAKIDGRDTYLLFPLPDRLLDSWRRCWNAYARYENPREALQIDEALAQEARDTLRAVKYDLQTPTVTYRYASNHSGSAQVDVPLTGWVGAVTYESFSAQPARAVEDLLFRFAFYRGSGYHTTQGLGQTRLAGEPVRDAEGG